MDVVTILTDPRTLILFALSAVDFLVGWLGHTKVDGFSADRFGDWLQSNVLKHVLPYAGVLLAILTALPAWLHANGVVTETTGWVAATPSAIAILKSIIDNGKLLGQPSARRA